MIHGLNAFRPECANIWRTAESCLCLFTHIFDSIIFNFNKTLQIFVDPDRKGDLISANITVVSLFVAYIYVTSVNIKIMISTRIIHVLPLYMVYRLHSKLIFTTFFASFVCF